MKKRPCSGWSHSRAVPPTRKLWDTATGRPITDMNAGREHVDAIAIGRAEARDIIAANSTVRTVL